ncbi:MAG: hypothetical protein ACP5TY_07155 [Thermodesulforhabdaceae bacterium]|jgi:hypothetical protein
MDEVLSVTNDDRYSLTARIQRLIDCFARHRMAHNDDIASSSAKGGLLVMTPGIVIARARRVCGNLVKRQQ